MATRWGILGTGQIAQDFITALSLLPKDEHTVVAVAASSKEKADKFAAQYDVPQAYGSYQELADKAEVDVVYIATIHINHVDLSLMCINAGKNVLCEKPMSLSLEGCKKVLHAAKEKGVLFVEAVWSRFFPAYKFIQQHIASGAIGEVKIVEATFTCTMQDVERITNRDLGGGGLMDVGIYGVQAANLVFKGLPVTIKADGSLFDTGVDKTGIITLRYSGDRFASLVYSSESSVGANSFVVRGTKGNIVVPDFFWSPNRVLLQDQNVKYFQLPDAEGGKKYNFPHGQGLSYEAQGVRECLQKGLLESPYINHSDSETIMTILAEVQKQLGVTYDFL